MNSQLILLLASVLCANARTIDQIIMESAPSSKSLAMMRSDGGLLLEGDMIFTREQWLEMKAMTKASNATRRKRNALRNMRSRWTNNHVPYRLQPGAFSQRDVLSIQQGLNQWSTYTCLTFGQHRNEYNYIYVTPAGGCSSMVGMTGSGAQQLTLGFGCRSPQIVAHEFGHALGFHHEQTRPDRDQYVTINFGVISPGMAYNFQKYDWSTINAYDVPYDYDSIMHYGQTAFANPSQRSIITRDPKYQNIIGSATMISFYDIKLISLMYNCNDKCPASKKQQKCQGVGFVGKDCECWCPGANRNSPAVYCSNKQPVTGKGGNGGGTGGGRVVPPPKPTSKPEKPVNPGDSNPNCERWAANGECQNNPGWMLPNCGASCKKYGNGKQEGCDDKTSMCSNYATYCRSSSYAAYMKINCPKTCGFCRSNTAYSPTTDCKNDDRNCESWAKSGRCSTHWKFMKQKCKRSCRVC